MREIKFRVWNVFLKEYETFQRVAGRGEIMPYDNLLRYNETKYIVEQYTGLKDMNGVEIYEGDIVKWGHVEGGLENPIRIAQAKFSPDIQFECSNIKDKWYTDGRNLVFNYGNFAYQETSKWLEVIGNIHD